MEGDPGDIAERLVQEHGLDRALQVAMEKSYAAQEQGDNFGLSIWRDVRRRLRGWDDVK